MLLGDHSFECSSWERALKDHHSESKMIPLWGAIFPLFAPMGVDVSVSEPTSGPLRTRVCLSEAHYSHLKRIKVENNVIWVESSVSIIHGVELFDPREHLLPNEWEHSQIKVLSEISSEGHRVLLVDQVEMIRALNHVIQVDQVSMLLLPRSVSDHLLVEEFELVLLSQEHASVREELVDEAISKQSASVPTVESREWTLLTSLH